jgi:hypothetical protein
MTSLVSHLRQQSDAAPETDVFNGVTYWTDQQLQDVLDTNFYGWKQLPMEKLGLYDNVSYTLTLTMPYWVESDFKIYVSGSTTEETTTYTYNPFTHEITFDSDVSDRELIAFAKVYVMTEAIADVWNQKAQHRFDFITSKAGSHRFEADQVHQHCVDRANYWRNMRVRSFKRRSSRFVRYDE